MEAMEDRSLASGSYAGYVTHDCIDERRSAHSRLGSTIPRRNSCETFTPKFGRHHDNVKGMPTMEPIMVSMAPTYSALMGVNP